MTGARIRTSGLTLRYPNRSVLQGVDFSMEPGELVAILGPSGAGKSSFLRTVAGLVRPSSGMVQVDDQPVAGPRADVALAFQDPCLLPWLSVERNVAFGLTFARQPHLSRASRKERVTLALREVALEHSRTWAPSQLSGGMAQRAALARCLARQPRALLLDEPFGALDEVTRADMQQLLVKVVRHTGASTLLVTHDIDEALLVADRILLLGNNGTVVDEWTVDVPAPRAPHIQKLGEMRIQILRALQNSMSRAA
ncbi:ABC transporter ATP-binding protein [Paraburkholderia hospita]|jgi:NitT/TauT family transport system ATP-binding protein|uniref:ABC transporter ATP-binding protein n=1 Tax=Paraburkholderia hospita TaxID=169430 RepID=A0AAN1MP74_9BURK|nr:ABC transporter ATP-binding protein [Paraburkholderia hospita]AUT74244.1 ABC transporter ATP-binding protein [Paraburkholderia hospita]EIN01212.1 nitrate/sulfonate/bicarbonate ABC transporter ATPase [Paraburkholderia hospita]OUL79764.1 ABC transporter ATP-binding protein [Paraburkholderia hospita]OUL84509.1 ABC transporter ATP-binding protein [Paraburkholderia hospita]SEH58921.1 NitT/TauT family transport system ATP-binding protein [Paraburkholderia hospita]